MIILCKNKLKIELLFDSGVVIKSEVIDEPKNAKAAIPVIWNEKSEIIELYRDLNIPIWSLPGFRQLYQRIDGYLTHSPEFEGKDNHLLLGYIPGKIKLQISDTLIQVVSDTIISSAIRPIESFQRRNESLECIK